MNETSETMPLSVAIRTGARLTRPLRGMLVSQDGEAACALGAALVAVGVDDIAYPEAERRWPLLEEPVRGEGVPCRCSRCGIEFDHPATVRDWVEWLNDDEHHEWSRERIAAWVKRLESK